MDVLSCSIWIGQELISRNTISAWELPNSEILRIAKQLLLFFSSTYYYSARLSHDPKPRLDWYGSGFYWVERKSTQETGKISSGRISRFTLYSVPDAGIVTYNTSYLLDYLMALLIPVFSLSTTPFYDCRLSPDLSQHVMMWPGSSLGWDQIIRLCKGSEHRLAT